MSFKYTLNRNLLALPILLLCTFLDQGVNAQITTTGGDDPDKKEKAEKVKTEWNEDSLSGTNFYFTGMTMWSYRTFEDQTVYNQYAERSNETGAVTGGISAGVVIPLANFLSLDLGLCYWGHGEKYAYVDTAAASDSTYNYKRRYLSFGVPLRIRATYGKKLQSFLYAGITPMNILQMRYDDDFADVEGGLHDPEEIKIKNDFSPFNLMVGLGVGINYNLKYVGFTLSAEYRRNMLNTYDPLAIKVDHRMYGIAFNYGMYVRF